MGIIGLSEFLRQNNVQKKTAHLSELRTKFGVDMCNFMYKYKYVGGTKAVIYNVCRLIMCVRKHGGCATLIFDGAYGAEKVDEVNRRRQNRKNIEERRDKTKRAYETYRNNPLDEESKKILKELRETQTIKDNFAEDPDKVDLNFVWKKLEAMSKSLVKLTDEDFTAVKDMLKVFGIEYVEALVECDHAAKYLYDKQEICGIFTQDSDTIAYGIHWITDLDYNTGIVSYYDADDVLDKMDMTKEEFMDFCILCGCDYNKRLVKIGPCSAFKLIHEFHSIERIIEEKHIDASVLNYELVRNYFTGKLCKSCTIPHWWPVKINSRAVNEEMNKYGAFCDTKKLSDIWKTAEITLVDSEENE